MHNQEFAIDAYRKELLEAVKRQGLKVMSEDRATFLRELAAFKASIDEQGRVIIENQKRLLNSQR
jgi:DNA-binding transcriptional regulator/RsmH inhibitor MraZ